MDLDRLGDRSPAVVSQVGLASLINYKSLKSQWLNRNLLIVITPYFSFRLRDSPFSSSAASWTPFVFTCGNFAFLIQATRTQKQEGFKNIKRRLLASISSLASIIVLLWMTAQVDALSPLAFFLLVM